MPKKKIVLHIIAIVSFIVGACILFTIMHNPLFNSHLFFFDIEYIILFDIVLTYMGISFFIEFYLSFKPIEVKVVKVVKE